MLCGRVREREKGNVEEVSACEVGVVEGSSVVHGAFKGLFSRGPDFNG